jgi:hypothetical protein
MHPFACPICSQLQDIETSFAKYGAPQYDRPLPEAAARLEMVPFLDYEDKDRYHVRRCPSCATLYSYSLNSEYQVNGSEDEETLTRMTPAGAMVFQRQQARLLEALRRDIDDTESSAGALGDYIDHGHPSPAEAEEAFEKMQTDRAQALHGREHLRVQVEALRRTCPEILLIWAQAHRRICQSFIYSLRTSPHRPGFAAQTAQYVARTALEAWEALPEAGETYIPISTVYLEGYLDRLDAELKA